MFTVSSSLNVAWYHLFGINLFSCSCKSQLGGQRSKEERLVSVVGYEHRCDHNITMRAAMRDELWASDEALALTISRPYFVYIAEGDVS